MLWRRVRQLETDGTQGWVEMEEWAMKEHLSRHRK